MDINNKNGYITKLNDSPVNSIHHLVKRITNTREARKNTILIKLSNPYMECRDRTTINIVIAKFLADIKADIQYQRDTNVTDIITPQTSKLVQKT